MKPISLFTNCFSPKDFSIHYSEEVKEFTPVSLLILHKQKKIYATVHQSLLYLYLKSYLATLIAYGYEFEMREDRWPAKISIKGKRAELIAKISWFDTTSKQIITVKEPSTVIGGGEQC